jgi:hypothetical protein
MVIYCMTDVTNNVAQILLQINIKAEIKLPEIYP